jgi:anti-anti-sigma factor
MSPERSQLLTPATAYSADVSDDPGSVPTHRVALEGEYDISSVPGLHESLCDRTDATEIVADLTGVTFMDSSGLRAMLEIREQLESEGRRLVLEGVPDQVARLFEVAGITSLFDVR